MGKKEKITSVGGGAIVAINVSDLRIKGKLAPLLSM